ncbi:MAG: formate dehydrogenase accessory sulfurtransferase FdhD [Janthinobacterium lividum]
MPPTERHRVTLHTFDGDSQATSRAVAVETPVNLVYGTVPYAVMMATPADLEDFARGFSLTEGVITAAADIRGIAAETVADGIRLVVDLVPARFHGLLARRRAMAGRTSCGVCGIEDLAALPRAPLRASPATAVPHASIRRALQELPAHQPLNAATRAVHAAAWAGLDGGIVLAREDVGRHNALDKLIGALLAAGTDPTTGFMLITSRVSYEMVEKTASFGAGTLVAISAPTSLGIAQAARHGITLIGIARPDAMTSFTGPAD